MSSKSVFLVFGATGRTGQHFVSLALSAGHQVRALVRSPEKMAIQGSNLHLYKGSISDYGAFDELVHGVDCVVAMLGDAKLQREKKINTLFVKRLIPAMRRQGVGRALLDAAEAWARAQHLPAMEVTVWAFNAAASQLYEKQGFGVLRRYLRKEFSPG